MSVGKSNYRCAASLGTRYGWTPIQSRDRSKAASTGGLFDSIIRVSALLWCRCPTGVARWPRRIRIRDPKPRCGSRGTSDPRLTREIFVSEQYGPPTSEIGAHVGFITAPSRQPPVTESFALPPDLKVECNDRLSGRNPAARHSAPPLSEMPNADDACAHLAGPHRIRTTHLRLLQMRSCRKNHYSLRPNEIRGCWLVRRRTTAAEVRPPRGGAR